MRRNLLLLAFFLLLVSMWLGLTVGQITPVKRNILYIHIPSAVCALLCFVILLVAGVAYLCTSRMIWDIVAMATAEIGLVFATLLNLTGMIFSRAEWNTWWTPSPRLVTSAVLWFLYVAYLILRGSIPEPQRRIARICAVFSIIAFLDVPLVVVSARFIPDIHRPNFSFDSPWQTVALVTGIIGMALLAGLLIWLKTDLLRNKTKLEKDYA